MLKSIKKIFKIVSVIFLVVITVLIVLFYYFSQPKSDTAIRDDFSDNGVEVYMNNSKYRGLKYRVLTTQKEIDTLLPTIVFVHGSVGSSLDFKKYMLDKEFNEKANLISYDRIGYGIYNTGEVQESIAFETALLEDLINNINSEKVILVGYSYGGPIVLASKKGYKKIMLLAPAVYSLVEPMPWLLKMYEWKATRWLLPKIWKAASKEKLSHKQDLQNFENNWNESTSEIISIHGNEDWIVPYENSNYLNGEFSSKQFQLITLDKVGHGLVWSKFSEIKKVMLQQLN